MVSPRLSSRVTSNRIATLQLSRDLYRDLAYRGRTASCPAAPAQIPACRFPAPGTLRLLLRLRSGHGTEPALRHQKSHPNAANPQPTLYLACELSNQKWQLGCTVGHGRRAGGELHEAGRAGFRRRRCLAQEPVTNRSAALTTQPGGGGPGRPRGQPPRPAHHSQARPAPGYTTGRDWPLWQLSCGQPSVLVGVARPCTPPTQDLTTKTPT